MAFGMAGLTHRSTRCGPTSAPDTCSRSLNAETSPGRTSRNRTRSSGPRWCESRASRSLCSYSSMSPWSGLFAITRTGPPAAS